MRKSILILILTLTLFCPISYAYNKTTLTNDSKMELIQNDVKIEDSDIKPIDTDNIKNSIVPDSHKESKKVFSLFLKMMFGVAICAILLYFSLLFIRKYYSNAFLPSNDDEIENLDLAVPNNKQDAIRSFLNRTK